MSYQVRVLRRAQEDVDDIVGWLSERSPAGAARWHAEFIRTASDLAIDPHRFGLASEQVLLKRDVRERFFKTPRGRRYRIVYTIVEDEVRVLRVRGPGQRPLKPSEL